MTPFESIPALRGRVGRVLLNRAAIGGILRASQPVLSSVLQACLHLAVRIHQRSLKSAPT